MIAHNFIKIKTDGGEALFNIAHIVKVVPPVRQEDINSDMQKIELDCWIIVIDTINRSHAIWLKFNSEDKAEKAYKTLCKYLSPVHLDL